MRRTCVLTDTEKKNLSLSQTQFMPYVFLSVRTFSLLGEKRELSVCSSYELRTFPEEDWRPTADGVWFAMRSDPNVAFG